MFRLMSLDIKRGRRAFALESQSRTARRTVKNLGLVEVSSACLKPVYYGEDFSLRLVFTPLVARVYASSLHQSGLQSLFSTLRVVPIFTPAVCSTLYSWSALLCATILLATLSKQCSDNANNNPTTRQKSGCPELPRRPS